MSMSIPHWTTRFTGTTTMYTTPGNIVLTNWVAPWQPPDEPPESGLLVPSKPRGPLPTLPSREA